MTTTMQVKSANATRLQKLLGLEERIRYEQLGEPDKEYREHLESLRLRVLAEIKLETLKG